MTQLIELQVLNKVLQDNNDSFLVNNGIDETYFLDFLNEYKYIKSYYDNYKTMPSAETISSMQTSEGTPLSMEFFEVKDSEEYLVKAIREQKVYNEAVKVIKRGSDLLANGEGATAIDLMTRGLEQISLDKASSEINIVTDTARLENVKLKQSGQKQIIRTGLPELDCIFYGWQPEEELATVVARTGVGKTWFLLYTLASAWKQGKVVGMYSGEMSAEKVGYRFDTIIGGFSNRDLVRGTIKDTTYYEKHLKSLKENTTPFYVKVPTKETGRATISQLRAFVKKNNIQVLGIDQFSLMVDERNGRNSSPKDNLEHIASDLFELSKELHITIIAVVQANRNGVKDNKKGGTPEIEDIFGADAIAQYSTKVISLAPTSAGLEIAVKKNRDGGLGKPLFYRWEIDTGQIFYVPNEDEDKEQVEEISNEYKKLDREDIF